MRFEAKHQGVKRTCKSMGFRNPIESVSKIMNESRKKEIQNLVDSNQREEILRKNSVVYAKIKDETGIFTIVDVKNKIIVANRTVTEYDQKLLAYKILKENKRISVDTNAIVVYATGLKTSYDSKEYVFFHEYLE